MCLIEFISNMTHPLRHALCKVYNYVLPSTCVLCGDTISDADNLCEACQQNLPILPHCCPQCAQILPATTGALPSLKCGACLDLRPPFDATYALFPYSFPIMEMIIKLKFQHQLYYALTLGKLLANKIASDWYVNQSLPDLIIPVPLHPKRLRERGFNQALEIVRPVAKQFRLPLDVLGCQRVKYTVAQTSLAAAERKHNMAKAFIAQRHYTGLTIAVVDDVITTGSTVLELCKVLKRHGAAHIDVWCCARNFG